MKDLLLQLCALSVFCGLALGLTPEGSGKKATSLCCVLLLMISVLTAFKSFDYAGYSLDLARYREMGKELANQAEEQKERLSRHVIEQECAEYIINRAVALGVTDLRAEVSARWDSAGVWVPDSVRIIGTLQSNQRAELQALISADLGIDDEHQEWMIHET